MGIYAPFAELCISLGINVMCESMPAVLMKHKQAMDEGTKAWNVLPKYTASEAFFPWNSAQLACLTLA